MACWRRDGDSNPGDDSRRPTVFKTVAFNRSAIPPFRVPGYSTRKARRAKLTFPQGSARQVRQSARYSHLSPEKRKLGSSNNVNLLSNSAGNGKLPNEKELESRSSCEMLSNSSFSGSVAHKHESIMCERKRTHAPTPRASLTRTGRQSTRADTPRASRRAWRA